MAAPEYPHLGIGWGFPISFDSTGVQLTEDEAAVERSLRIILRTAPGDRVMRPRFGAGLERYVFAPRTDETAYRIEFDVERALLKHEPRIIVDSVSATRAGTDEDRLDIRVDFRTDHHRRPASLVMPFYLDEAEQT